jgi:hypothetical protein
MERGSIGKISRFNVIASIFRGVTWKVFAYMASFLVQIVLRIYISCLQIHLWRNPTEMINVNVVRVTNTLRNIHFIMLNLVVIDGFFYSSRIITHIHSSAIKFGGVEVSSQSINLLVSYVIFFMLSFDLVQVYQQGMYLSRLENPYHQDDIKDYDEAIKIILAKQHLESKHGGKPGDKKIDITVP